MSTLLLLVLIQTPFLLYLWLVPPEKRAPSRKVGAWLLTGLSLLGVGSGILHLHWEDRAFARASFGFAILAALAALARALGWIGPRDPGQPQTADATIDERAAALRERYRRPAVLLHRPYPPHAGPSGNSHFGGLPALPRGIDWPRTSAGVPLHFLCQIDFADVRWSTPLPDRGLLLVFVREDSSQQWGDGPPADDFRILYVPTPAAATGPAEPPHDLPAIGWDYPRGPYREVTLDGDPQQRLHVRWPIQPLPMDTFPDQSGLPELVGDSDRAWRRWRREYRIRTALRRVLPGVRTFPRSAPPAHDEAVWDQYGELLPAVRASALEAATGAPVYRSASFPAEREAARRLFGDPTFPSHWIFIHYFARVALRRHRSEPPADDVATASWIAEAESRLDREARDWFERSRAVPLETEVGETDRRAFRDWAWSIQRHPRSPPGSGAIDWSADAAFWTIRDWAAERRLAGMIGHEVHEAVAHRFHANSVSQGADKDWYSLQFSQMLGHAPSSQDAAPADAPDICLLNLSSDRGLGWSFWDAGEIAFWISPEDLAARDFSRVRMSVNGH